MRASDGETRRVELSDGAATTVHIVRYPLAAIRLSVVRLEPEAPLEAWCAEHGIDDALSGGFAVKPDYIPLGAVAAGGRPLDHRPFHAPWDRRRGAVAVDGGPPRIDALDRLAPGAQADVIQAGPVLVREGGDVVSGVDDPEGFSSTADEFDQDITAERQPRLALALTATDALCVAADGRGADDAGMLLGEFAALIVALGARSALNFDGGSAAVLVAGGRRINTPRDDEGNDLEASSPSVTALVIAPRT
jgi:hypothetical protein